jgi:hypothetical protein
MLEARTASPEARIPTRTRISRHAKAGRPPGAVNGPRGYAVRTEKQRVKALKLEVKKERAKREQIEALLLSLAKRILAARRSAAPAARKTDAAPA